jgi:hypothetical protein
MDEAVQSRTQFALRFELGETGLIQSSICKSRAFRSICIESY